MKPKNLTFEQAAVIPISGGTALQSLRRGNVQPGQKVLIVGASGGVGSFAVQLAKVFGAKVTGVSSTSKLDFVRSLGADDVIDYTREDFTNGTRRWDFVLDTGGRRSLLDLRRALTPKGTLVIVGGEGGGNWLGGFDRNLRSGVVSLFVSQRLTMLASKERGEVRYIAGVHRGREGHAGHRPDVSAEKPPKRSSTWWRDAPAGRSLSLSDQRITRESLNLTNRLVRAPAVRRSEPRPRRRAPRSCSRVPRDPSRRRAPPSREPRSGRRATDHRPPQRRER